MKLKEIAAISGKPGLYKILKSTPKGVIVETLDEQKKRSSIGISHRVSILKEISIYTTSEEGIVTLEQALHDIHQKYAGELPVHKKSEEKELREFLAEIISDYDRERVFISDMKKLVSWYAVVYQFSPETFETLLKEDEEEENKEEEVKEETTEEEEEEKVEAKEEKKAAKPKKAAKTTTSKKPTAVKEKVQKPSIPKTSKPISKQKAK
jgi:hypothetical protein